MKKFHGHHMLSLSLFLSADADPESFDSDNVFFIFHAVLVDKGREDPNTTKAGRHRHPAKLHLMTLVALESISVKIV